MGIDYNKHYVLYPTISLVESQKYYKAKYDLIGDDFTFIIKSGSDDPLHCGSPAQTTVGAKFFHNNESYGSSITASERFEDGKQSVILDLYVDEVVKQNRKAKEKLLKK